VEKNLSKIALAGASLALVFTISCGEHGFSDLLETKCGGKEYNASEFSCVGGELVGKCRGKDYYPEYQVCKNGQIEDIDNNTPGSSSSANEEMIDFFGNERTLSIENITPSSFTQSTNNLYCLEPLFSSLGVLSSSTGKISYSKNGTTLSFGGLEFNGNSSNIIGTWTRNPYSVNCGNDFQCQNNDAISKVVFTQNSVTYTTCLDNVGITGELLGEEVEGVKIKTTDCNTKEFFRGTERVIEKYYPDHQEATYNGKTCKSIKTNISKECSEMINILKEIGIDENSEDYEVTLGVYVSMYLGPRRFDSKCLEDNNFPKWYKNTLGGYGYTSNSEE